jgi:hypothetical protein
VKHDQLHFLRALRQLGRATLILQSEVLPGLLDRGGRGCPSIAGERREALRLLDRHETSGLSSLLLPRTSKAIAAALLTPLTATPIAVGATPALGATVPPTLLGGRPLAATSLHVARAATPIIAPTPTVVGPPTVTPAVTVLAPVATAAAATVRRRRARLEVTLCAQMTLSGHAATTVVLTGGKRRRRAVAVLLAATTTGRGRRASLRRTAVDITPRLLLASISLPRPGARLAAAAEVGHRMAPTIRRAVAPGHHAWVAIRRSRWRPVAGARRPATV